MSLSSFFLWCVSGILIVMALSMLAPQPEPSLTLERGLGPEVTTSEL